MKLRFAVAEAKLLGLSCWAEIGVSISSLCDLIGGHLQNRQGDSNPLHFPRLLFYRVNED